MRKVVLFSMVLLGRILALIYVACPKLERAAVTRDLAKAKAEGMDLRYELNLYKLEHGAFPGKLRDLKLKWSADGRDAFAGSTITWVYSVEDDRRQCRLATLGKADGYHVSLLSHGELEASEGNVPHDERHVWAGAGE
ncbi:MAG: hypothetical protein QM755_02770 [Luteolibacter sp.]